MMARCVAQIYRVIALIKKSKDLRDLRVYGGMVDLKPYYEEN